LGLIKRPIELGLGKLYFLVQRCVTSSILLILSD
jgi:hypothetical protein